LKSCTTNALNASASAASTARRRAKQAASARAFGKNVTIQTHVLRQVNTPHWRRDPARWDESQSGTRQARLVLVISELRAREYGIGRARDGSQKEQERHVGGSAAGAAVAMAMSTQRRSSRGARTNGRMNWCRRGFFRVRPTRGSSTRL
jgi:hypothetical protein